VHAHVSRQPGSWLTWDVGQSRIYRDSDVASFQPQLKAEPPVFEPTEIELASFKKKED
jgi:hypothetical protein